MQILPLFSEQIKGRRLFYTDYLFLLILPIIILINALTNNFVVIRKLLLIIVSFAFFISWGGSHVIVFIVVTALGYGLSLLIANSNGVIKKGLFTAGILGVIGILIMFKYSYFIAEILIDINTGGWMARLWAPMGISFYVFHIVSYLTDIFTGKIRPSKPIDYVAYISFFPHLMAGPIVRGIQLIPQLERPLPLTKYDWSGGIYTLAFGFFLKTTADVIAYATADDWKMSTIANYGLGDAWAVALLFSCQIFSDFAGYSYMAIGMSRLMGIELPINFNAPYLSTSFKEFWTRWHMSLSFFLRDYLYIGFLGGNRKGFFRAQLNTFITMLIGGLWHGANMTFVLWGGLHGLALIIERLLGFDKKTNSLIWIILWGVVVQIVIILGWVLFRSPDFEVAKAVLSAMFAFVPLTIQPYYFNSLLLTLPVLGYHLLRFFDLSLTQYLWFKGACSSLLVVSGLIISVRPRSFIYFEF